MSDAERRNPPKIGKIVTYRFQELTPDGVPRFPSYIGVRIDADKPSDYKFAKKDVVVVVKGNAKGKAV